MNNLERCIGVAKVMRDVSADHIAELERQLAEATAEVKRITDMLSDSPTVHVNILRGNIKISKANLIHAAGLPANIEEQLVEALKAAKWVPIDAEHLPTTKHQACTWMGSIEEVKESDERMYAEGYHRPSWKWIRLLNLPSEIINAPHAKESHD